MLKKDKTIFAALAFLLPVLLLLGAYAWLGVYPFGEKTLLLVDMDNEYIDYYAHLHRTLRQPGGSFLRAWEMGMGLNMMGLIAFYTASPMNILLLLAPLSHLTEAVLLLTLLKVGLCGLLFFLWAHSAYGDRLRPWLLTCAALAYGLCGYNLAYTSNIMWLDGVAMLPIVLLGCRRLWETGRWGMLALSLAYVFVSSYYIGYMVGAFAFLYCTVGHFARGYTLREYGARLRPFLGAALLAAACCAFLLLPAFLNLKYGQADLWALPVSFSMDRSFMAMGAKLLPGAYDSLTDSGLPNIYCTVAGAVGTLWFFTSSRIARRRKLWWGGLCAFLLVSFSCDILYLGWHAFEDPTWFPARFSFVFSFLLLDLALQGLAEGVPAKEQVLAGGGILFLLFAEVGIQRLGIARGISLWLGLLLVPAYCVLALAGRGRKAIVVAALLVCGEAGYNAVAMVQGMDLQFGYKSRVSYTGWREEFEPAVRYIQQADNGVYRMEILQQRNANGGLALGYYGISHYSTTTDQQLNMLLRSWGYNTGTINELRFSRSTPLTNGLLGVRYVLSREALEDGYELVEAIGEVGVYRNRLAVPVAFYTAAMPGEQPEGDDPFLLQNRLLEELGYGGVFLPLQAQEQAVGLYRRKGEGDIQYHALVRSGDRMIRFLVENPTGQQAYAYLPVHNRRFSRAIAAVDGVEVQRELAYRNNAIISLGAAKYPQLELRLYTDSAQISGSYFYALDMEQALEYTAEMQSRAMAFSIFSDTVVEGMITAPADGYLATTIPFDKGWRIWINGERMQPQAFAGVFLSAPLEAGENRISMKYSPPGFRVGAFVSVVAAGGWILYWIIEKRKRGNSEKKGL